ncbi:alpha/beta fold hydrolase, partial [Streptomyces sp. NPDC053726]|uniref:alpha/beta fold hydrolase n=1 Tax=Streptomyces sp. NPDC048473 TaxID=3365556 RepID=UPI00371F62A4
DPRVEGARTPVNRRSIAPCRSRSMSSMQSAPAGELAKVTAPSLVFWGALDPVCQIEFGEQFGAAVRVTRVLHLEWNHWTVLQRPAEVAAALKHHWNIYGGA